MKENITGEIYSGQSMTGNTTISSTTFIEPNMEIGTVETTEEAEASITGTRPNFVLNLGLPKGDKGEKGDTGDSFTYDMFTDEQLASLKGEPGVNGKDGYTPVKGKDYFDGVDGKDGKDGTPCTHVWSGTTLFVTSANGTSSANLKGERGEKGETGATGLTGATGRDGYTPVKGKDYFDGKDGANGRDGVTPTIKVGTTITGDAGTNANVTMNQNGTEYTLNFTIPKGDKGETGEAGSGGGDVDLSNYYTKTEIDNKNYITNDITTDFNLDGKVYLNTVGTSVNSNDSSRIVFGTSSKAYSWIASNTSGAFSFSKGDGNILIYPKTGTYNCIMTDCESDIGRTDKKWKNLYMSGSIINGSFSIPVSKIANTDNYYTKSEIDAMLVNGDEVSY